MSSSPAAAGSALTMAYVNRNHESGELWDEIVSRSEQPNPLGAEPLADALMSSARGLEDPMPWLITGAILALLAALALGLAASRR
jgi:hypothetical protein